MISLDSGGAPLDPALHYTRAYSLRYFIRKRVYPPDDRRRLIEGSPMRAGFTTAADARTWIVDLLAAAARQQQQPWWQRCDEYGDPAIHGTPSERLRNRTGLAAWSSTGGSSCG